MKTYFTPGPWIVRQEKTPFVPNNKWEVLGDSPHIKGLNQTICEINGPHDPKNYKANAHLIGAAPDLFAQLQKAIEYIKNIQGINDVPQPLMINMEAAINKAKGNK